MAGITNFAASKLLDTLHRNGAAYQPAGLYLGVYTTNPNFDTAASGVEASGGSYARKAITFGAASAGASNSSNLVEFTAGSDIATGTYTGFGIFDAATAGNLLEGVAFGASKVLSGAGDKLSFAIGAVVSSLD